MPSARASNLLNHYWRGLAKRARVGQPHRTMTRKNGLRRTFLITFFCIVPFVILAAGLGFGQAEAAPEEGGHEVQVWAGGGHSVAGGTSGTGIFDLGLRYGWVITGEHLPGILRGRFEYTVDAVPAYLIFQRANTAYGVGFTPLGLKWNFERRGRLSPYLELDGGAIFSNHSVPTYANTVNFTPGAAFGTHILGEKYNWSLELWYLHISNAGLAAENPGLNTVQVRVGVGRFWRK
jgi:hypothetical protein